MICLTLEVESNHMPTDLASDKSLIPNRRLKSLQLGSKCRRMGWGPSVRNEPAPAGLGEPIRTRMERRIDCRGPVGQAAGLERIEEVDQIKPVARRKFPEPVGCFGRFNSMTVNRILQGE